MMRRLLSFVPIFVALTLIASQGGFAGEDKEHTGVVVKAGDGKLTMTAKGSAKPHTHKVDAKAKITVDGKAAKLEDLKKGFHVHVRMTEEHVVTSIRAHSKHESGDLKNK